MRLIAQWYNDQKLKKFLYPVLKISLLLFLIQLAFYPFYLNNIRIETFDMLFEDASLITSMLQQENQLNETQKEIFSKQYHIDGLIQITHHNEKIQQRKLFLNDNIKYNDIQYIRHLTSQDIWKNIKETIQMISLYQERYILIQKEDLGIIIQRTYMTETLRNDFFTLLTLSLSLILMTSTILRYYFCKSINQSINHIMTQICQPDIHLNSETPYDTTLSYDNIEGITQKLQTYISKQNGLISLRIGKLAHDMRNLLTSLQLCAENILEQSHHTESTTSTRFMLSIEKITHLCDWATQYIKSNKILIERKKNPLNSLVKEVLSVMQLNQKKQEITFVNKIPKAMIADYDHILMFRIVHNILLNSMQAIQNTKKSGIIRLSAKRTPHACIIHIRDTGPGMDNRTKEQLFIPYAGENKTNNNNNNNTGLGMSIANELALWHGGIVDLISTTNTGSKFRIIIPDIITDHLPNKLH